MAWPLSSDYSEAIQNPGMSFSDPELRRGQPTANALGLPVPSSGNFADVYEVRCPATKQAWAVKCFTREVPGLRERYRAITAHLGQADWPFSVECSYLDKGIRIRGQWYPVLKMDWVDGLHLHNFVRENLDEPRFLGALAELWLRQARKLRKTGIVHGDLQHGNVLLELDSQSNSLRLKLIDYDGMLVPILAGSRAGEVGHPAYQHPERLRKGTYGAEVDCFSNLLIYCALRCLMDSGRGLWDRFDNGDNMLFQQQDLDSPGTSPLFQELWKTNDPGVRCLAGRLMLACRAPLDQVPSLDQLVSNGAVCSLTCTQQEQVEALLAIRKE